MLIDRNISIVDNNKKEVEIFESALIEICKVNPDANEYACLRAIFLFKTCLDNDEGRSPNNINTGKRKLKNPAAVTALHDQSVYMLTEVRSV